MRVDCLEQCRKPCGEHRIVLEKGPKWLTTGKESLDCREVTEITAELRRQEAMVEPLSQIKRVIARGKVIRADGLYSGGINAKPGKLPFHARPPVGPVGEIDVVGAQA